MRFLLEIVVILLAVKLAGQISQRLGQPSVLGKLLVGVLLGPAILGWLHPTELISELAEVGVILLMFLAGIETNLDDIRKSAVAATLVAVGGVVLPFVGGWATAALWGYNGVTAVFVGVLLVATSVSISVQTLRELGRLRTPAGVTILAAAVLDDVLGIIVLSVVLGLAGGAEAAGGGDSIWLLLLKMAVFFVGAALVGWKLLPPALRWVRGFKVGAPLLAGGIAVAMAAAYAAELSGLAGIVGAYVIGLTLSRADFRDKLMHSMEDVAFGFFVPFFFVSVGLAAEFTGMSGSFLTFVIVICIVAIVAKWVGGTFGALLGRFKSREALGVGAGMIARGEVGLIVAAIGLERQIVTQELYTAMVIVSLVTTLVTPPILKVILRSPATGSPEHQPGP